MSRKTQSIKASLDQLDELDRRLKEHNENVTKGAQPTFEEMMEVRELEDIEFQLKQQTDLLRMWFESLYKFTGRSTSSAKQKASRRNGKKGGRPTKEVSETRKRIAELSETEIPQCQEDVANATSPEQKKEAQKYLRQRRTELTKLQAKLEELTRK